MVTKPKRNWITLGTSYDGLEDMKKVDLVSPSEEPKPTMYIAMVLHLENGGVGTL